MSVADRWVKPEPDDPVDLALALCHEVGNLLAAARLSAYLVAREEDRAEILASAEDIETVATQAGAALAHIRPLLRGDAAARLHVDPAELLEAASRSVEQPSARSLRVETSRAADLPDVLVDPDGLHRLLVTLVLAAWDASPEGGVVSLGASAEGSRVVFAVQHAGRPWEEPQEHDAVGPRGRGLALRVAATLAARWDGEVRVVPLDGGTRIEIRLPAAQA